MGTLQGFTLRAFRVWGSFKGSRRVLYKLGGVGLHGFKAGGFEVLGVGGLGLVGGPCLLSRDSIKTKTDHSRKGQSEPEKIRQAKTNAFLRTVDNLQKSE